MYPSGTNQPLGIGVRNWDCQVKNASPSSVVGEIVGFDVYLSLAQTTHNYPGSDASGMSWVRTLQNDHERRIPIGVVLNAHSVAEGTQNVRLSGIVQALVGTGDFVADPSAVAGDYVYCRNGKTYLDIEDPVTGGYGAAGDRIPAMLLEDTPTFTANDETALLWVWFDGTPRGLGTHE